MARGFRRVEILRPGAAHDLLRRNEIALSRGNYLHITVVKQQAWHIGQLELQCGLQPMMTIHDCHAVVFQHNRDAPDLLAPERFRQACGMFGIMALVRQDRVGKNEVDG